MNDTVNQSNLFTIAIKFLKYNKDSRTFITSSGEWNLHGRHVGTIGNPEGGNVIEVLGQTKAVKFVVDHQRQLENEHFDGMLDTYISLCKQYRLEIFSQ